MCNFATYYINMEYSLEKRIEILKQRGYNLSVGTIMEDSFSRWKKILFYGVFVILFSYLFSNVITMFIGNILGTQIIDAEFQRSLLKIDKNNPAAIQKILLLFQQYINNPLIIKKLLFSSVSDLLLYPLTAGVVYCAYRIDKSGTASFKDLIHGFQGKKFISLLGLTVIVTLISLASIFLFLIPVLYFIPAFILAGAFIIIDNASLLQAIKCSMQVVNMRFGQIFSILVISFLIGKVLGLFMCGIGLLLTIPFSYAVVYSIYKNTIGTIENPDENRIEPIN